MRHGFNRYNRAMARRIQFSLRELLLAMLVVAAFFGGMAVQPRLDEPTRRLDYFGSHSWGQTTFTETVTTPDGTEWERPIIVKDGPETD